MIPATRKRFYALLFILSLLAILGASLLFPTPTRADSGGSSPTIPTPTIKCFIGSCGTDAIFSR